MYKAEAFEQWFLVYAEVHKLPKGSPFRVAIWHHCKAAWEACEDSDGTVNLSENNN